MKGKHTQTDMDLIDVNFFNVLRDFEKQTGQMQEKIIKQHPQPSLLQGGKTKEDLLTTYPMVK